MSEELSRVEDLLENGVEQPVLPMSELEAILRGEKIKPHSRVAELLLQYNPQDILIEKRIDKNGTYYASADNADGYFKVIVDTPVIPPTVLDHLVETITENGTYNYTPEHDGYSDAEITVNVPSVQPTLITKTITENGTYEASDDNADGYSQAVVNVTVPLGSKSITSNGTYTATDDDLDGYSSVSVDVPQIGIKDIPNTPTPIATFSDGSNLPMPSLKVGIEPVQSGSGDPSPENVRPISGWTEEVITRTGANIWGGKKSADDIQEAVSTAIIDTTNKTVEFAASEAAGIILSKCKFKENISYTFIMTYSKSKANLGSNMRVRYTDGTLLEIPSLPSGTAIDEKKTVLVTSDSNKTVQSIEGRNQGNSTKLYYDESGIFEGTLTAEDFKPYAGTTTTIPFTDSQGTPVEVYGGSADVVNGQIALDYGESDLGDLEWNVVSGTTNVFNAVVPNIKYPASSSERNKGLMCTCYKLNSNTYLDDRMDDKSMGRINGRVYIRDTSYTDTTAFKTSLQNSNAQLVYEVETQQTINTQPTSIKSLDGENIIWASTGQILSGQYFGYVYPELGTKNITENGTYDPADDGLDGYSEVEVNVPSGASIIFNGQHMQVSDTTHEIVSSFDIPLTVGATYVMTVYCEAHGTYQIEEYTACFTKDSNSGYQRISVPIGGQGTIYVSLTDAYTDNYTGDWRNIYINVAPVLQEYYDEDPSGVPASYALLNKQISSISSKYMGPINLDNSMSIDKYYSFSFYHSDESEGSSNNTIVHITSLPTELPLTGLSAFRVDLTATTLEVNNYDGSAKDIYMTITEMPANAILVKPD